VAKEFRRHGLRFPRLIRQQRYAPYRGER
jgi:hypothetical protein